MKVKNIMAFAIVISLLLLAGGCAISSRPYLRLFVQDLNREPGEVIEIFAIPVNFLPNGSEVYDWSVKYWDGDNWNSLDGHLFPQDSGQSALLYLPDIEYEKLWVEAKTMAVVDGELKNIGGSRIIYYSDKPDVAVEIFENTESFIEPDNWFRNWGIFKEERTPFFFRYVEGFSMTTLLEFDPYEGRIMAIEIIPNASPTEPEVYFHGKLEVKKSESSVTELNEKFDDVNIGEGSWRRRIKISADLSSIGGDGLPTRWNVTLYPDIFGVGFDPDNESIYLIRAVRTGGTFVADRLIDVSILPLTISRTSDFGMAGIVVKFTLDESELGIGPLLDNDHYFGVMLVGYAPESSEFNGETIIEIPTILGAEMIFSPDANY
ncbi:hypothetical protein [Kosmotoga pacifica]|uniref:Uncharacterized protein n=1 Tax=Kosmotoga pacifica TaxID=1330330 RepID=A0A0G2ZDW7_9BACT|nr:hypothetical protein [Kosmotoga pacifica]AKI96993.1 hypothetical protein IX53_03200 [Kosmotoga pacifica]